MIVKVSDRVGALRDPVPAAAMGRHAVQNRLSGFQLEYKLWKSKGVRCVNLRPNDPEIDDDVSIRWLATSIMQAIVAGLRRNKLAAVLATVTLVVLIALAVSRQFDGLQEYQGSILPRLLRLETTYLNRVRAAENATGEWREYYFKEAHSQVRDILRAASLDRPEGDVARRKHREFTRYYELLDSEFNRLRRQMSAKPNLDYMQRLTDKMKELKPIRDNWAGWAILPSK